MGAETAMVTSTFLAGFALEVLCSEIEFICVSFIIDICTKELRNTSFVFGTVRLELVLTQRSKGAHPPFDPMEDQRAEPQH